VTLDPRTPVIVGVGQAEQRIDDPLAAAPPAEFIASAVQLAAADAGLSSLASVDSLRVVSFLSWRYRDPARFISLALGITPKEHALTTNGGNSPQSLVNQTALDIQAGRNDVVVLCGGETSRTRKRARAAGVELPWPVVPEDVAPDRVIGEELKMNHEIETSRQIWAPIQIYPMFETALRARAGRSPQEHMVFLSELWSRFSHVAAGNPHAWIRQALSPEEIRAVGPRNRMIGFPYPKLMNSNNDVDQSASLIMCSVEAAERLGISRDKWVFPLSGSDCHEHMYVSERWEFTETPAIKLAGKRVLELAGTSIDEIDIVDLYSCFPSAVQLGAAALGLPITRQLTRTGGLPFAGGPWNNYVMHAIATVVHELRERPSEKGLVWANGGYATKHAFGVYSATPSGRYAHDYPQDQIDALPKRTPVGVGESAGAATIEAYTVMHDRDGAPERAIAACLLPSGGRAWGDSLAPELCASMCEGEWVGRAVRLSDTGELLV
jgi:acetyl-CoA C-acetyltransferase